MNYRPTPKYNDSDQGVTIQAYPKEVGLQPTPTRTPENKMPTFIVNNAAIFAQWQYDRRHQVAYSTPMFRVYFSVL